MACIANNPRVTRQVDAWKYQAIAALPASSFGAKRSKADMLRWAKVMQSPDLLHGSRESKLDVLNKFDRYVSLPISVYRLGDLEELGVKATPLYEVTRADKDWWDKKFDEDDRKENPIFLPKSLFDSYVVKSDGGEFTVDRIQTLKGAEKKVAELARKYPCIGFSIKSAKHGGVIKHYAPAVGGRKPRVDQDNSREYKREATQAAKDSVRFRLFVNGSEYADYETKGEAEKVGKKEAGSGGKWRVKQVAANPSRTNPNDLPPRNLDTIGDAISLSSPSGRSSARSRKAAEKKLSDQLFGAGNDLKGKRSVEEEKEIKINSLLSGARELRRLAALGMKPRAYIKEAEKREQRARNLELSENPMTGVPSHAVNPNLSIGDVVTLRPNVISEIKSQSGTDISRAPHKTATIKEYGGMGGFLLDRELYGYRTWASGALVPYQGNPMTGVPAHDIPLELRHGRSQREAVAMALSEQRRVAENPVEVFMSERDARRFAASTLGASVIPGQSGGWVVVYPVGGRSLRNPRYDTPGTPENKRILELNDKQDRIQTAISAAEREVSSRLDDLEELAVKITSEATQRIHGKAYDAAKRKWETAKRKLSALWKQSNANIGAINRVAKRNPSDEDAAAMYETFHGEPSEEVLEYHVEEFERVDWATLGDLIQLKVETSTGKLVELNAPDPERSTIEDVIKLVSSPDGKQMAFVGGDQCLDEATLTRLGFTEADIRDNMVIGLVREFTYRTQKAFDKFKTIDYYHEAGEEHPVRKVFDDFRRKPTLLYCPHDGLMRLAGGLYQVKDVGVVN